jgi:glycerol-3-phosphate dehydrogenase
MIAAHPETDARAVPSAVDVLIVGGGATGAGLLRDLGRRGLRCLMIDKGDLGSGTSGRYHGLLHSGARYVARDPQAARECIRENQTIRRIAPACVEDTSGLFVATPDDPDDYVERFPERCAAAGIPCDEVPVDEVFRREPALNRRIRRAFRVPDASMEPWQLIESNLADARAHGGSALAYHELVSLERTGDALVSATIADRRSGTLRRISPRLVVSAAGAWAGRVAGLAGARLEMAPGKGTMLVYNQRMTDTTINRCHPAADGDIMVPVHTVAILGTTDIHVTDPDHFEIDPHEIEALISEGEKLFPDLRRMRLLRAYAGVRPLYDPAESTGADAHAGGDREITRSHAVIDHERRDGISNFVSIVGGKLTTYRLMAEQTADLVASKLDVNVPCTTAQEPLPGQGDGRHYWVGDRLAEHETDGGGDAALICECEFVTRSDLERFLAERWPCSLDDVRRGTRLGMGPCQGAFCTFRAAGMVADGVVGRMLRPAGAAFVEPPPAGGALPPGTAQDGPGPVPGPVAADPRADAAALAERAMVAFLRERYKGSRPIAWGRQLQELWIATAIYWGTLGVDAFEPGTHAAREVASGATR